MHPTPLDAERAVRRNFGFDAVGALGTGLFNALVVNFLAVIARREGADPLLLAALAAAPFALKFLKPVDLFDRSSEILKVPAR